jgi:hypothetical protein
MTGNEPRMIGYEILAIPLNMVIPSEARNLLFRF